MVNTLTYIINKLMMPKYPEIIEFEVRNMCRGLYSYCDIIYTVNRNMSIETTHNLVRETKSLYLMLGTTECEGVYVSVFGDYSIYSLF